MNKITFELGDKQMADLKAWADEAGLTPDDLARELVAIQIGPAPDLTPDERKAIEQGLRDIEEGRVVPQEEVFAKLDARYAK